MEFFKELSSLLSGTKKVTIIAQSVGDQITVGFFPEFASKDINEKVKMCSITGTPEEMDQGFFAEIRKPIEAASAGLKSNAEEVATEIKAAAEEELEDEKAEKERKEKAAAKKSAPVKKAAPTKKVETKKPAATAPKKEAKKKEVPDHNEGTTAEEIKENALIEKEVTVEEVKPIEPEEPETIIELDVDEIIANDGPVTDGKVEDGEMSEDHRKFNIYMLEGDQLMKEKDYQKARVTYQNAMVLARSTGNAADLEEATRSEKEAGLKLLPEETIVEEPKGTTPEEASPVDKQTAFDELMSEGAELMKSKDYKTAQSKYELAMELVESNPKNYDAAARKYREATMWVKARERMNS